LRNLDKGHADIVDFSLETLVSTLVRVVSGSLYIFCAKEQVSDLYTLVQVQGMTPRLGIWQKTNPSPMNGQHFWLSGVECCVFGRFKGAPFNEFCKNSVWQFPSGRSKRHPTEKPLKLWEYLISASSRPGDLVLDPFCGSGTTGEACQNLGRQFVQIDREADYIEIAKRRLKP
jgi:hypothetical protein